jgi:hypothetical protein
MRDRFPEWWERKLPGFPHEDSNDCAICIGDKLAPESSARWEFTLSLMPQKEKSIIPPYSMFSQMNRYYTWTVNPRVCLSTVLPIFFLHSHPTSQQFSCLGCYLNPRDQAATSTTFWDAPAFSVPLTLGYRTKTPDTQILWAAGEKRGELNWQLHCANRKMSTQHKLYQ